MHARVEQLLNLRDGEPADAGVRAHVEACPQCAESLAGLAHMRQRVAQLPPLDGGPGGWESVQERIASRAAGDRRRAWASRAALAASIVAIAAALSWRLNDASMGPAPERVATALDAERALAADRMEQLRLQSQALEDLLADLPASPVVERAGTALPIDTLEAQVQWVDHELFLRGEDLEPGVAERLWRERVAAMNSLVQLRYVDAQRTVM